METSETTKSSAPSVSPLLGPENESSCILSTAYFGPVQWYQKLNRYRTCYIERYDSFIKQTFRNRCIIATANGPQALTIPVERPEEKGGKLLERDVRISDHGNWRHLHWNALASAYGESPFYEFYADDLRPFFERKWTYLYDFNWEITLKICELLDIEPNMRSTEEYIPEGETQHLDDYRSVIRPKHPLHDDFFTPKEYYQVFALKTGFRANLSILDLLFNEGNEAVMFL